MDPITFMTEFKKGSNDAFKMLFSTLNNKLIGHLINKTDKSFSEIEDIVAECWYKLFIHREKFESLQHIERFCFRVCRNADINLKRSKNSEHKLISDLVHIMDTCQLPYENRRFERMMPYVEDQLKSFQGRRGEIIRMHLIDNIKMSEIARKMGIGIQTCYNRKCQALTAIKERLLSIEHLLSY